MSLLVRILIAIVGAILGFILVGLLVGSGVFQDYSALAKWALDAIIVVVAIWYVIAGATWFGGTRV